VLTLTLALRGRETKVELNGEDISRFLCGISVASDVSGLTTATLRYRGAVVVEMMGGRLTLVQAPVYVTCGLCHKTIAGAPAEGPVTALLPPRAPAEG